MPFITNREEKLIDYPRDEIRTTRARRNPAQSSNNPPAMSGSITPPPTLVVGVKLSAGLGVGVGVGFTPGSGSTMAATERLTDASVVPPDPEQFRTKVPSLVSAFTVSVPDSDLLPFHKPDAVHSVEAVEFETDHVSVVDPLYATLAGLALKVMIGILITMTVASAVIALPVESLQLNVNVLEAEVSDALVSVPEAPFGPVHVPPPLHPVVFVVDQVSVVVEPLLTVLGFAVKETVAAPGGGCVTVTVTVADLLPPVPVQVIV